MKVINAAQPSADLIKIAAADKCLSDNRNVKGKGISYYSKNGQNVSFPVHSDSPGLG